MTKWVNIQDRMPKDAVWVIVLAEIISEVTKGMKVAFQAKHESHVGWSDWCGDLEKDDDWKVIAWVLMPDEEYIYGN